VVVRSRSIFAAAERDAEAWVRSLLPPLEMQVREQRQQLKKRTDSVSRIRDAQGSLDERIGQLEDALQQAQGQLAELKRHADRICAPAQETSGAGTHAEPPPKEAALPLVTPDSPQSPAPERIVAANAQEFAASADSMQDSAPEDESDTQLRAET